MTAKKKDDDTPAVQETPAQGTTCTCPKDWTAQGHAPECPKRKEVIGE